MCGLCGVLGVEDHWSDTLDTDVDGEALRLARRRDLAKRAGLANALLKTTKLKLKRWQTSGFMLSTATGRTILVPHLAALPAHLETLTGSAIDPLDPDFLASLSPLVPES